jgi:hypothetical protein
VKQTARLCGPFLVVFFLLCVVGRSAFAQNGPTLDGLAELTYDDSGKFHLGDTVDAMDISAPKQRCIKYRDGDPDTANSDIKSDTQGAVGSKLQLLVIRNYDEADSQLKFSYSYQASVKVDVAKLGSGGSSLENLGKYEDFFKNERSSLMIVLEASARHGRDYIGEWSLKDEFNSLLQARMYKDFEAACGTHFIRDVTRISALRVEFKLTNLNESSKRLISDQLKLSSTANVGIGDLNAETKSEWAVNISSALNMAKTFGKFEASVSTTGGEGVKTVAKALQGANLTSSGDIAKVIDGIVSASSDLTRKNSAPEKYVLTAYPQTSAIAPPFNSKQYNRLGEILKILMRIDEIRAIYGQYKNNNLVLWNKYFAPYDAKFSALRGVVMQLYMSCRNEAKCDESLPPKYEGIFLDDILTGGSLDSACPRSFVIGGKDALSSIMIKWGGSVRFADEIDFTGTQVFRIKPDLTQERINFEPQNYLRLRRKADGSFDKNQDGTTDLFLSVFSMPLDQDKANKGGLIDSAYLLSQRNEVARSVFVARFNLLNGIFLEEVLGMPDMRKCLITSN